MAARRRRRTPLAIGVGGLCVVLAVLSRLLVPPAGDGLIVMVHPAGVVAGLLVAATGVSARAVYTASSAGTLRIAALERHRGLAWISATVSAPCAGLVLLVVAGEAWWAALPLAAAVVLAAVVVWLVR